MRWLKKNKFEIKPERTKNKKGRARTLKKILISLAALFLLAGGIFYLLVFSPFFTINNISISGDTEADVNKIKDMIEAKTRQYFFEKIPVANPLFFNEKDIDKEILDKFPEIREIDWEKNYLSHTLSANIKDKGKSAIWCKALLDSFSGASFSEGGTSTQARLPEAEKCYFVDENGFAFLPAPITSGGILATIYDKSDIKPEIKKVVASRGLLDFIIETKKQILEQALDLTDFLVDPSSPNQVTVLASSGWLAIFDVGQTPANQVTIIKHLLSTDLKDKEDLLDYIDLRIRGKAYYKLK